MEYRLRTGKAQSLKGCRAWRNSRFAKKMAHRRDRRAGKLLVDVSLKIGGYHN